jgi:hypothetical protein
MMTSLHESPSFIPKGAYSSGAATGVLPAHTGFDGFFSSYFKGRVPPPDDPEDQKKPSFFKRAAFFLTAIGGAALLTVCLHKQHEANQVTCMNHNYQKVGAFESISSGLLEVSDKKGGRVLLAYDSDGDSNVQVLASGFGSSNAGAGNNALAIKVVRECTDPESGIAPKRPEVVQALIAVAAMTIPMESR